MLSPFGYKTKEKISMVIIAISFFATAFIFFIVCAAFAIVGINKDEEVDE